MTPSTAGDLGEPDRRHSTFSEAIGTGNFRQQSCTGDVEQGESFFDDGRVAQLSATAASESLGFESSNAKSNPAESTRCSPPSSDITAGSETRTGAVTVVRDLNEKARLSIFPPLLTSLKANGRPRFNLEKLREGGRLLIVTVPNDRPEVLRIPKKDGRVRMQFIDGDHEEEREKNPGDLTCDEGAA